MNLVKFLGDFFLRLNVHIAVKIVARKRREMVLFGQGSNGYVDRRFRFVEKRILGRAMQRHPILLLR